MPSGSPVLVLTAERIGVEEAVVNAVLTVELAGACKAPSIQGLIA